MGTVFQKQGHDLSKSEELWKAIRKGKKDALELLFYTHYDDLYRYAYRFSGSPQSAEDHIQKLFLKIWERRKDLSEVESVKTYLWTALRRSIIATGKIQKREETAYNEGIRRNSDMYYSIEEIIIHKEEKKQKIKLLYRALNELSPRQKEILYLKYFEGLGYDEIEQITSLSYQTIRNYVYESIKILKKTIKEETPKASLVPKSVLILLIGLVDFI